MSEPHGARRDTTRRIVPGSPPAGAHSVSDPLEATVTTASTARLTVSAVDRFGAGLSNRFPVQADGSAGVVTFRYDSVHGYAIWRDGELLDVLLLPGGPVTPERIQPFVINVPVRFLDLPD